MTKQQYMDIVGRHTPVKLSDGRMGLALSYSMGYVQIDAYRGNDLEELWIPVEDLDLTGDGALVGNVARARRA